jgi:hypothetical protein
LGYLDADEAAEDHRYPGQDQEGRHYGEKLRSSIVLGRVHRELLHAMHLDCMDTC